MIKIVQEVDSKTRLPICNPQTCPTMSAAEYELPYRLISASKGVDILIGSRFTYTWLDNNRNPIRIPAHQYISLVQKWIMGKINDTRIFPIDTTMNPPRPPPTSSGRDWLGKASGFPDTFENDIRSLYRQMFRCYAHLYHGHWLEPFYHLGASKELNTCFIHFVNVGKLFNLLDDKDMKPMQPLVDIWLAKGLLSSSQAQQQTQTAPQENLTAPSVSTAAA